MNASEVRDIYTKHKYNHPVYVKIKEAAESGYRGIRINLSECQGLGQELLNKGYEVTVHL